MLSARPRIIAGLRVAAGIAAGLDPPELAAELVARGDQAFVPVGRLIALERLVDDRGGSRSAKAVRASARRMPPRRYWSGRHRQAEFDKPAIGGRIAHVYAPAGEVALIVIAGVDPPKRPQPGLERIAAGAVAEVEPPLGGALGDPEGLGGLGADRRIIGELAALAAHPADRLPERDRHERSEGLRRDGSDPRALADQRQESRASLSSRPLDRSWVRSGMPS